MDFVKYQGTGNDFVLVNGNRQVVDPNDYDYIKKLSDRRFGIGGDGFIIIRDHSDHDFEMLYYNADGRPGSLCGNGSRCAVAFAFEEGFFEGEHCNFMAYDGLHEAIYAPKDQIVELKMNDVSETHQGHDMVVLDTGSPHYVTLVEDLSDLDIVQAGRAIRYSPRFAKQGINVNFVEPLQKDHIRVATYERGVEDETYSCGTGVTACALGYFLLNKGPDHHSEVHETNIQTRGGDLKVRFQKTKDKFTNIWLIGPAIRVFEGRTLK